MKTIRVLVAMAIMAAVGLGIACPVDAADRAGRKVAVPAMQTTTAEAAAMPVKKEKKTTKKAGDGKATDLGKKIPSRKKAA